MKFRSILKSTLLGCQLWATCAFATGSIQIESDSARYDHNLGRMIHQGNVIVHWVDKVLTADTLTIVKSDTGEVRELWAKGHPAIFEGQLTPKTTQIQGSANAINFEMAHNTIILKENAELNYAGDIFEGPVIRFNFDNQTIFADKSDSVRPKLIFGAKFSSKIKKESL